MTFEKIQNNTDNNISRVSRASGEIRDRYIASELGRMWKEGKNIFAVYGMNHARNQEPFLRGLLNCN